MTNRATGIKIALAFLAIYLIWGSTYLVARMAIETLPPLLMAGMRTLIGGALLFAWGAFKGQARPTFSQWRAAAIAGGLMLLVSGGTVIWSLKYVPSGVVALLMAVVPFWITVIEWFGPRKVRPGARVLVGIGGGLLGMVILIQPWRFAGQSLLSWVMGAVVLGTIAKAFGILYARNGDLPKSSVRAIAMQMVAGGSLLVIVGSVLGEWSGLRWDEVSATTLWAFSYLLIFGSMVGFCAFGWLLQVVEPTKVATYAYVNPVVALVLGSVFGGEALGGDTVFAAIMIVGSVVIVSLPKNWCLPSRRTYPLRQPLGSG